MSWVKCSEKLPPLGERILLYQADCVFIASRERYEWQSEDKWIDDSCCSLSFHLEDNARWMPLPKGI